MLHIRPPRAEETWGALSAKEIKKTSRQQSITPANTRRRTNRFTLGCFARRRAYFLLLWLLGGRKVASLGLGGGQVAVLCLHAAVTWLRNDCTILAELGERITQLQYFLLAHNDYLFIELLVGVAGDANF
jgi:hypothetical protein